MVTAVGVVAFAGAGLTGVGYCCVGGAPLGRGADVGWWLRFGLRDDRGLRLRCGRCVLGERCACCGGSYDSHGWGRAGYRG